MKGGPGMRAPSCLHTGYTTCCYVVLHGYMMLYVMYYMYMCYMMSQCTTCTWQQACVENDAKIIDHTHSAIVVELCRLRDCSTEVLLLQVRHYVLAVSVI
jgi:hypothetical protein